MASASYLNTKIPYHDKILISYPSIMIGFGINSLVFYKPLSLIY